jgi:hypothetical protein
MGVDERQRRRSVAGRVHREAGLGQDGHERRKLKIVAIRNEDSQLTIGARC